MVFSQLIASHLLPRWLEVLLTEKFYNACIIHEEAKKNEKNVYCLDCCTSLCPHCLSPHRSHRILQIRRYVYHDVIRLDDAAKLMDCAFVQSYTTNSAKVVFLHQRPQTRNFRGSGNFCSSCDRSLQDPYLFCSLSCKVLFTLHPNSLSLNFSSPPSLTFSSRTLSEFFHFFPHQFPTLFSICLVYNDDETSADFHLFSSGSYTSPNQIDYLIRTKGGISEYLSDFKSLSLPAPGLDDGSMTPESVLEPAGSSRTSSGSGGYGGVDCKTLGSTATTEIVRKKRSSLAAYRAACRPVFSPVSEISASLMNRRKGTPQRSPLY